MEILFSDRVKKELDKLNFRIQRKVLLVLEKFKSNLRVDIIKLKDSDDEFRIRAGNYRIQIQKVKGGFLVAKVGKRENFYLVFL